MPRLYAGGADSVSIRTVLRWAGLNAAGASSTDIRTAFLNAPGRVRTGVSHLPTSEAYDLGSGCSFEDEVEGSRSLVWTCFISAFMVSVSGSQAEGVPVAMQ